MFDLADASLAGAGICTGLMTEDFAFEQGLRQAAAIDGDEIAFTPRTRFVQAACDQFLAGTGLALNQQVGRAVGQTADQLAYPLHSCGVADQPSLDLIAPFQAVA